MGSAPSSFTSEEPANLMERAVLDRADQLQRRIYQLRDSL
jgi:hypothetical protein